MPEHSLGSYHMASVLGADYVEPDLVLTKDGVPVCMHDPDLMGTTDVADRREFAHKRRNLTAFMYGENSTVANNWFTIDFTLKELKQLRLKQRKVGIRPLYFDGVFAIPTFQEYLDKMKEMSAKLNRTIGLVPELKHATFHNSVFGPHYMENKVLEILEKNGYPSRLPQRAPLKQGFTTVVLQSFEAPAAQYLRKHCDHDIMLLVDKDWTMFTRTGLDQAAAFATVFSPWKEVFDARKGPLAYIQAANVTVDRSRLRRLGGFVHNVVRQVHQRHMRLVVYTFYDSREMPTSRTDELDHFFDLGVDGLFVENVAEARQIKTSYYVGRK